jgi:hypothetical protein
VELLVGLLIFGDRYIVAWSQSEQSATVFSVVCININLSGASAGLRHPGINLMRIQSAEHFSTSIVYVWERRHAFVNIDDVLGNDEPKIFLRQGRTCVAAKKENR